MLLHFHNPSCGYNQRCNLYQETVPLIQSILASLFLYYLFTKSFLKFPLTLPSYINQQFFSNLFLRTTIPIIYTKNVFFTSNIISIQAASRYQEVREYCEDWHCLTSSFFLEEWRVIAGFTHNPWFFIRLRLNSPSVIHSTYFHYQLIAPQELTFPWKPVA